MHFIHEFQVGTSIPEKKLQIIKKSFHDFPKGKEIYFYCDTSPFKNGKQGFVICEMVFIGKIIGLNQQTEIFTLE